MEINEEILERLQEFGINKNNAISYLLSIHFNYIPDYIPSELNILIAKTGIIVPRAKGYDWKIPLFNGGVTAFDWVKSEYIPLFKAKGKGGYVKEATALLKKFFAKNPDVRKEDIIGAAKLYLQDNAYPRFGHYFIRKGRGLDLKEDIYTWLEEYRNSKKVNMTQKNNSMQL